MAKKSFYETEEFKHLQRQWDVKLAQSGFDDIEAVVEKNGKEIIDVKRRDENIVRTEIIETERHEYNVGTQYFEFCMQILREYKFKKPVHFMIFEKHAEGMSERQIRDWLKSEKDLSVSHKGINLIINRIKDEFREGGK